MSASIDELHQALLRMLEAGTPSQTAAPTPVPPGATEGVAPDPSTTQPAVTQVTPPSVPCQVVDAQLKGYHLDAHVTPDQVVPTARFLDDQGFAIDTVTGVDWIAEEQMEIVYDFFHPTSSARVAVRTRVPRAQPELPTISGVFPGANWHERETHDFYGIRFLGHPDLSPLLLPEDADYHPLRKDFPGAA